MPARWLRDGLGIVALLLLVAGGLLLVWALVKALRRAGSPSVALSGAFACLAVCLVLTLSGRQLFEAPAGRATTGSRSCSRTGFGVAPAGRSACNGGIWSSTGQRSATIDTTAMVPTPPLTTAKIGPKSPATAPLSKAPSSFEKLTNSELTLATRPRS